MLKIDDIKKIALLSQLKLNEEQVEGLSKDLNQILDYMAKLDELDLKDVKPTSHAVSVTNVFREDKAEVCQVKDKVLDGAPDKDETFFKVPRVI